MLLVGVFLGATLSTWLSDDRSITEVPLPWRWRFGDSVARRFAFAFVGGAVIAICVRVA
jgi:uncharacterized protein